MAKQVIIPAANRPFELGMLYDCRDDTLIVSDSPWSKETLCQLRHGGESSCNTSELKIEVEDNFNKKAELLNISGTLKLSIMSGLVSTDGSAKYLTDRVSSARQERVSARAQYKTAFKHLVNPSMKIDRLDILQSNRGTHYVAGITYGANAVFVFDKWHNEERHLRDPTGSVNAFTKAFTGVEVNGEANAQLKADRENLSKGFKCTFYGDIKLIKNPVTLEDAVEVYRSLPSLVGEGLPMEITLEPIEWLTSKTEKICLEIRADIVEDVGAIFEDIQTLRIECNDLLCCSGCTNFPRLLEDLKNFLNVLNRQKQAVQLRVKQLLPEIRSGATPEAELVEFINTLNYSRVACKNLKRFLEAKRKQINTLTVLSNDMPEGVEVVAKPGAFEMILLNAAHKFIVSYTVSTVLSVSYLEQCLLHIKIGTIENSRWQELLENEENMEIDRSLREKAKLFKTFYDSNYEAEKPRCKFIVMEEARDEQKVSKPAKLTARIQLYKENSLQIPDFIPAGKPGKLCKTVTCLYQIHLAWTESSGGSETVNYYEIEYGSQIDNSKTMTSRTEGHYPLVNITNLQPGMPYKIRYRGCADSGRGSWSDYVIVRTRKVGAPRILRILKKGIDYVCIEWQKPTFVVEGMELSSVTFYIQRPREACWTELLSSSKLENSHAQQTIVKVPTHEAASFKMTARCSNNEVSADSNIVHSDTISGHDYVQELNQMVNNLHQWTGVEDFPAQVITQLSRLERVARHAQQDFRKVLESDVFCAYWDRILAFKDSYTQSQVRQVAYYLNKIFRLETETAFSHKEELLAFANLKAEPKPDMELELNNCAKKCTQIQSIEQISTLLYALSFSANGAPALFRRMLMDRKFDILFNYLLEEREKFSTHDVNAIKIHLKSIIKASGSSNFSLRTKLLEKYPPDDLDEPVTSSPPSLETSHQVANPTSEAVRQCPPKLTSTNSDVASRLSSLREYFLYLSQIAEQPLEKANLKKVEETLLAARIKVRQALANKTNDLTFFDVMQLALDATIKTKSYNGGICVSTLQTYCHAAGKGYEEFERFQKLGRLQLHCYLLKLAIKCTQENCFALHIGSPSSLKQFQDSTFDDVTCLVRSQAAESVSNLLRRFAKDTPYDFELLLCGLNLLQNGDSENADKLERLLIPNLNMSFMQADVSPHPRSSDSIANVQINTKEEKWDEIEGVLNTFGLSSLRSISLWDVMKFSRRFDVEPQNSLKSDDLQSSESFSYAELPILMLKKILMLNFMGREEYFENIHVKETGDIVTDFLFEDDTKKPAEEVNGSRYSPMDVLLIAYNCCHPLLKQVFVEKLFTCKLAVPFIHRLNDGRYGISSWALRSIVIDWKTEGRIREKSVIDCAVHIMSFVRIARPKFSKSDLLNVILHNSPHNTFFSHNCTGGSNARLVADGLVEAAWYSPSNADQSQMQHNMMILNLRGNAFEHTVQTKFLTKISSLILAVISVDELPTEPSLSFICELLRSNVKLLILLTPTSERTDMADVKAKCLDARRKLPKDSFERIRWIHGFTMKGTKINIPDLKCKIQSEMNSIIPRACTTIREWIEMGGSEDFGFVVDEEDVKIKFTKTQAKEVFEFACREPLQNVRSLLLPLQGSHWNRYSDLVKEFSSVTDSEARARHRRKQVQERNEQLRILIKQSNSGNPMLHGFISCVLKYVLSNDDDSLMFFLQWLKLYIDEHTRDHLPAAAAGYRDVVKQLRSEKKKELPDLEKIKILEEEKEDKERILSESSFGLEHIMREVAQVYEAVKEYDDGSGLQENVKLEYEALPRAAAKLLLRGFPLELMDGDAANVPITWIRSVLQHAEDLVGNKKLFILAVLGIQSSGKSTLLNTMFGLRFAVSAGRCTRGIFMQLVPVDSSSGYKFDYLLVIDTEGLRSSELRSQHYRHDNELATLVIGLGDLTILNIKGEDLTEVKDILEIVVQAFLKMKVANARLNLEQSCVFVHQNVSAVNAPSQMEHGHLRLQNILDKMTEEAARHVHKVAIRSFNQVINYDGEKHIKYFSDLWKGDPPMAPANPGYSRSASKLRNMILEDAAASQAIFYSFSNLAQHVQDLWSGIICQDFIFSFRNCLEIKAFTRLEDFYCILKFKVDQFASDLVARTARVRISGCNSEDELEETYQCLLKNVSIEVEEKGNVCLEELENYFDSTDDLIRISIQWKGERNKVGILGRFSKFIDECKGKAHQHIRELKNAAGLSLQKKFKDKLHRDKILRKARQFAEKLRDANLSEELLVRNFEEVWKKLEEDFALDSPSFKTASPICKVLEELLYESMLESTDILRQELNLHPISERTNLEKLEDALKTDMIRNELLDVESTEEIGKCRKDAVKFLKLTFSAMDAAIKEVCVGDDPFQESIARQILQQLKEAIRKKNASVYMQPSAKGSPRLLQCKYTMPDNYAAMVLVTAARYMNERFERMQEDYESKHGVQSMLGRLREEGLSVFKSTALQTIAEVSAANSFWASMCVLLKETVVRQIQDRIPNEVIEDFGLAKHFLIKRLLVDLASPGADKKQQFANYMSYFEDAASFALKWITTYTNDKYFKQNNGKSKFGNKCSSLLDRLLNDVMESVDIATDAMEEIAKTHAEGSEVRRSAMQNWVKTFCEKMRDKEFAIHTFDLNFLTASAETSINFEDFRSYLMKEQGRVCQNLKTYFHGLNESLKWDSAPPYQFIFGFLWGCRSQCPFCEEPCRYMSDHEKEHMCIQHRPQCCGGYVYSKTEEFVTDTCNSMITKGEETFLCRRLPLQEAYDDLLKVDLAFLLDVSNSTKPYMEILRDHIEKMAEKMRKEEPKVQLNLAYVGYRDHCDGENSVIVLPFTRDVKTFKNFVKGTKVIGSGDGLKDVLGGLEEVGNLPWTSANRIIFHFADLPCYGTRFCNYESERNEFGDHNASDFQGMERLITNLKSQNVQYYFGRIADQTYKMTSDFNKAAGCANFVAVRDASNLSSVPDLVLETVTASLRRSLRNSKDKDNIDTLPDDTCEKTWHFYKDYKKCASDWEIAPEQSSETTLYWQRFLHIFQDELKDTYSARTSNFDPAWSNIGLKRALESLDSLRG